MALRTPEAPEKDKNRIDEEYARGLNSPGKEQADGIYQRGRDRLDSIDLRDRENRDAVNSAAAGEKDPVRDQEKKGPGGYIDNFTGNQGPSEKVGRLDQLRGAFTGKKKKGPVAAIIALVFGSLGIGGAFFGLALSPQAFFANTTFDLDDQMSALDIRTEKMLLKKFRPISASEATSLGCSTVGSALSLKCEFVTFSEKEIGRHKAVGIDIEGDTSGIFGKRVKPTKITYLGVDYSPDQFVDAVRSNRALANAYKQANNMNFIGKTGVTFVTRVLGKFGLSLKAPELKGSHEERVKSLMARSGANSLNNLGFTEIRDSNGDPTGEYTLNGSTELHDPNDPDSGPRRFTQVEKDAFDVSINKIKVASRPPSQIGLTALRAVSILGAYDTVCSLKNVVGAATIAAKVANAAQLAEYAMPVAALAGSMKSGDISEEDNRVLQEFFNNTDAREMIAGYDGTSEAKEVPNPNYGKNALDSELYKMSANGGVAYTSVFDKSYSLGFGADSLLRDAARVAGVADNIVDLGSLDACDKIQSWWARGGGLAVGLVAGFFTGGGSTVLTGAMFVAATAASVAFENILASALTGTIITEAILHAPVDRGTAVWTGMSVLLGQSAQARGMMPGNSDQIVAYQIEQNRVKQEYVALERETSDPLDVSNPYSLTGTIAYSLKSHLPNNISSSSLASLPVNISSFVVSGFSSIIKPYSAQAASLDPERFKQCDDDTYKEIGIDADVQCNVRYVMPPDSLNLDPLVVAQWMEDNGYVEVNTTSGLPKGYTPPSPAESQGLAMDLIKGVKDTIYNSRSYGDDDPDKNYEEYGKFLDFCVYRVLPFGDTYEENGSFGDAGSEWKSGEKCLEQSNILHHFRAYTFDRSINDDLRESPIVSSINCGPFGGSSGGSTGAKMSETELRQQITSWGLDEPQAQTQGEVKGYEDMIKQLREDPKAAWAVQSLLNGEKEWKAAGGTIIEYLNTGWMWIENGQESRPDPYQINCAETAGLSMPSEPCPVQNWQVAGYQAGDRAVTDDYLGVFEKLYSEDEMVSVLEGVLQNSKNASLEKWDYGHESQQVGLVLEFKDQINTATTADIARNLGDILGNRRTQFFTILLGKDPSMVAALNSFAVTESDVVAMLRDCNAHFWSAGSDFYCDPALRPRLANMIMALYMFDGQGPAAGADCSERGAGGFGGGAGISAVWGGEGEKDLSYGFDYGPAAGPWYSYATEYGMSGTTHTGTDIPMDPYAPVYSPVEGVVVCEKNGVGDGIPGAGCAGAGDFSMTLTYGVICNNKDDPEPDLRGLADGSKERGAGTVMIKIMKNGQETGEALRLGHLASSLVKLGDTVKANQQIGTAGCMNGWHTHVEYFIPAPVTPAPGGTPSGLRLVDPVEYLSGNTNV